jgi:hypothetical protein
MSDNIGDLAKALSVAQGQIKGALKDSANTFFKSKYADLSSVWEACRGPLSANGLSVIQTTCDSPNGGVTVVTTLAHESGQWIRGSLTLAPKDQTPQGYGSAITYSRRYALAAIVGVAPEDDDGNAASASPAPTVKIDPKAKKEFIVQVRDALSKGDEDYIRHLWSEWDTEQKLVLWAEFNSQERSSMKKMGASA